MQFRLKQLLVRQLRLVLSNERRRQSAAERELHYLVILARTEEHPDAWLFVIFLTSWSRASR